MVAISGLQGSRDDELSSRWADDALAQQIKSNQIKEYLSVLSTFGAHSLPSEGLDRSTSGSPSMQAPVNVTDDPGATMTRESLKTTQPPTSMRVVP